MQVAPIIALFRDEKWTRKAMWGKIMSHDFGILLPLINVTIILVVLKFELNLKTKKKSDKLRKLKASS